MTKHTPGPWICAYGAIYATKEGATVRLILADRNADANTSPTERDRNLQLAAQAPAMVEVIRGMREAMRKFMPELDADTLAHLAGEWIDEANEVINNATGCPE